MRFSGDRRGIDHGSFSVSYLLEPDVEVKGHRLSGVADGGHAVFHVLGRAARDELHSVGA